MKRNISLMLGIIVGICALISFLQPNFVNTTFGSSFRIENLEFHKLSRDIKHSRQPSKYKRNFDWRHSVADESSPDKCL